MKAQWMITSGVVLMALFLRLPAQAQTLSLDHYLKQVEEKDVAIRASLAKKNATGFLEEAGKLSVTPSLFADATHSDDRRPTVAPIFQGDQTLTNSYSLGFKTDTTFGLSGKLYYRLDETEIKNAPLLTQTSYSSAAPTLELRQSLWRNSFGRETRRNILSAQTLAQSQGHMASFEIQSRLVQAELNYYRLALARLSVATHKELLDRSIKIVGWATRRAKLNLGDRVDMLQAQAGEKLRRLEYQAAMDEEKSAARIFNETRSMNADTVAEQVDLPLENLKKMQFKKGSREDLLAKELSTKALRAQAEAKIETVKPQLDLVASYAYGPKERSTSKALDESVSGKAPWYVLGISFSVPLDFSLTSEIKKGRLQEIQAAELDYRHSKFVSDREWQDLLRQYEEAQTRLEIHAQLKEAQKTKMDYERNRLLKGRTTTFQVLSFEQDYATAELSYLRALGEVLGIQARLKLFEGGMS